MKKIKAGFHVAVLISLCLATVAAASDGVTVLVFPARYSVLQVAFDLVSQRDAVLVSYQGEVTSESPLLHYWNGADWIRMSLDDYAQARFLSSVPKTFILVGGPDMLPAVLERSVSSWCSDVRTISAIDTPTIVNSIGSAFAFQPHEWEWFARRYNLQLKDENEDRRKHSWYERDSYEDKWSDRWHWLRRKYNRDSSRTVSEIQAPVAASPTP